MIKKIIGRIWKKLTPAARVRLTRFTQKKFTVSVSAVVTNERGEVLLLDHVLRPFSNWGTPGGFIEAGEQPAQAVAREVLEETGLELKNVRLIGVRTTNRHVEIVFRAEASGRAEAKSYEINHAAWFSVEEIPEEMGDRQKTEIRDLLEFGRNNVGG